MTTRNERWVSLEEEPLESPTMLRSIADDYFHRTCEPGTCDYAKLYLGRPLDVDPLDAAAERRWKEDQDARRVVPPTGLAGAAAARKAAPMASGVLFYFPNALAAVAALSKVGNDQHNPGEPLGWSFTKSTDEADCIVRHLAQSGTVDTDGVRHATKVAWRALALLERELLAAHPELQPGRNVRDFTR